MKANSAEERTVRLMINHVYLLRGSACWTQSRCMSSGHLFENVSGSTALRWLDPLPRSESFGLCLKALRLLRCLSFLLHLFFQCWP